MALAIVITTIAAAQEAKVPDIELDFRFLRLGLSRKAVINTMGAPNSQTKSQTLMIKYHRLMWTDPEGQKFVAAFVQIGFGVGRCAAPAFLIVKG